MLLIKHQRKKKIKKKILSFGTSQVFVNTNNSFFISLKHVFLIFCAEGVETQFSHYKGKPKTFSEKPIHNILMHRIQNFWTEGGGGGGVGGCYGNLLIF